MRRWRQITRDPYRWTGWKREIRESRASFMAVTWGVSGAPSLVKVCNTTVSKFFIIWSLNLFCKESWMGAWSMWISRGIHTLTTFTPPRLPIACHAVPRHRIPVPKMCRREFGKTQSEYQVIFSGGRGLCRKAESPKRPWFLFKPEFAGLKEIDAFLRSMNYHGTLLYLFLLVPHPCISPLLALKMTQTERDQSGDPQFLGLSVLPYSPVVECQ